MTGEAHTLGDALPRTGKGAGHRRVPEDDLNRIIRLALDHSFDRVLVHTPDGIMLYANESAAADRGLTADEMLDIEPWGWATTPTEVRDRTLADLQRVGSLRFTVPSNSDGTGFIEVQAHWVETDTGPLVLSIARDITAQVVAEKALRDMAFHDPLTGLANRSLLDDRLAVAIANAERHGDLLGVVFVDIDDFKPVNDTYGHECGDEVLKVIAHRLLHAVRSQDTVARLGGDEFVVLLPRLKTAQDLDAAAEKLREIVEQPIELAHCAIELTASTGTALYDRERDTAHSVVVRADMAMYEARGRTVKSP